MTNKNIVQSLKTESFEINKILFGSFCKHFFLVCFGRKFGSFLENKGHISPEFSKGTDFFQNQDQDISSFKNSVKTKTLTWSGQTQVQVRGNQLSIDNILGLKVETQIFQESLIFVLLITATKHCSIIFLSS